MTVQERNHASYFNKDKHVWDKCVWHKLLIQKLDASEKEISISQTA